MLKNTLLLSSALIVSFVLGSGANAVLPAEKDSNNLTPTKAAPVRQDSPPNIKQTSEKWRKKSKPKTGRTLFGTSSDSD